MLCNFPLHRNIDEISTFINAQSNYGIALLYKYNVNKRKYDLKTV